MKLRAIAANLDIFGRQGQFYQMTKALTGDRDLLLIGVPGSGRRTLVRRAALEVGAKVMEVDCIRAADPRRLIQLICEGINQGVKSPEAIATVTQWIKQEAKGLFGLKEDKKTIKPLATDNKEDLWTSFEILLPLPQKIAESVGRRIVLILYSFPHLRSWDRNSQWENFLRSQIKSQPRVSYVLVATITETSHLEDEIRQNLEIITLTPLSDELVAAWIQEVLHSSELTFDARSSALEKFLEAVKGHMGDASDIFNPVSANRLA